jgi:hypothetical protein
MILLGNLRNTDMPIVTDKFYNSIFQMWAKLNFREPIKPEEILKQMIWNNSHIKVGNKTVYSKKMVDKKILYIQDLLNKDGKFANKVELEQKFDIVFRFFEYESLNQAIPQKWKEIIEDDKHSKNMIINKEYKIKINNIYKQLAEIETKDIYWELLTKVAERPTSDQSWNNHSDLALTDEEWKTIYKMAYKLTQDTKLFNFNFKVTHRILAVGEKLKTWKSKDTDKCENCDEKDTVEHFLVKCPEVLTFWQQVFIWWQSYITYARR